MDGQAYSTMLLGEFLREQFVEKKALIFWSDQLLHVVPNADFLQRALGELKEQGKIELWAEVTDPATDQAVWDGLLTEAMEKFKRGEFDKDFQFAPRLQLTQVWTSVLEKYMRE